MAESSKRQRVRGSSSTAAGRCRRQSSPIESSPSPSPPPSPTLAHQNLQFSTLTLSESLLASIANLPSVGLNFEGHTAIDSFGLTQNADNKWVHKNSPPPPQRHNEAHPQQPPPPTPLLQQQTTSFDDVMRGSMISEHLLGTTSIL
ncbi:hypothetical protein LR48_Vigan661s003500 [Vigna angularis]|uniref:Uncharacterized protein n=1 Tax=Phaseolus angularis TaxID=3914 RepID=A0A0L9TFM1_PHAAN|nr:hypothetical protein LR48_Vigan661s003500 [Vigna angularis]